MVEHSFLSHIAFARLYVRHVPHFCYVPNDLQHDIPISCIHYDEVYMEGPDLTNLQVHSRSETFDGLEQEAWRAGHEGLVPS
jgi:hypothetical protein